MLENLFEGFEQIKVKRETIDKDVFVVSRTYVSLSRGLLKKYSDSFVGFYLSTKENRILVHFSKVKQTGYFKVAKSGNFKSKAVLDAFHALGFGTSVIDKLERLNYLSNDTIEIKGKK